jgi:probable phosphoglycerate mutase
VPSGIRFAMAAASIAVLGFEHAVRQIIAQGLTGHTDPCKPR